MVLVPIKKSYLAWDDLPNGTKKRSPAGDRLVNLKSNTMKNTLQR